MRVREAKPAQMVWASGRPVSEHDQSVTCGPVETEGSPLAAPLADQARQLVPYFNPWVYGSCQLLPCSITTSWVQISALQQSTGSISLE